MKQLTLIFILFFSASTLAHNAKLDYLKLEYTMKADATYTLTVTQKLTALSNYGAEQAQKRPITYYPDAENFKLISAYLIKQDGSKVPVKTSQIFTRSAQSRATAPGFDNRLTTTVVFPTLSANDATFIQYQITRKKPLPMGFSMTHSPNFGIEQGEQDIVINAPKDLFLRWAKQGPYHVRDHVRGERRLITATLNHFPEIYNENNMADLGNNLPYFSVSTSESWNELGVKMWDGFGAKIDQTDSIVELANRLTKDKSNDEAARAIYNWVTKNIHYIAVYFDESAGVIPHKASKVLENGYGDCKDNAVLMIALLQAAGIEAKPVLIQAGNEFFTYPLPNADQFNHAIVYIPSLNTFADPTSEFSSFGILDSYLSNKFVLIGGKKPMLKRTPAGKASDSTYDSSKHLTISENGDIEGTAVIKVTGRTNASSRSLFSGTVNKLLAKRSLEQSEGGLGDIETSDPHDLEHDMLIKANWHSPQAVNLENESYFNIPIGIDFKNPGSVRSLIQQDKRKYPTMIGAGTIHWNTVITLPRHFSVTHIPKNRRFKNLAGRYFSQYKLRHGKLYVSRTFVINKDVFAPDEYLALKALLYQPIKDARSVVGMKKA